MKVFYNSGLSFHQRLYGSLDASLRPIRLAQPLEELMSRPGLHARGPLPQACLHSLTRYQQQERF